MGAEALPLVGAGMLVRPAPPLGLLAGGNSGLLLLSAALMIAPREAPPLGLLGTTMSAVLVASTSGILLAPPEGRDDAQVTDLALDWAARLLVPKLAESAMDFMMLTICRSLNCRMRREEG